MKFPAYPKYKPSGVEWLGDVPENWDVKRSDAIVSADRSQLSPEAFADREVYHYSIPVVQETGAGQIENGESIASAKQVIKKPVVLVSKLNPRKATICLAKPQAILTLCSTEFVALNADKCELGFLEYLTRSELFRQGLDSKVQSVTRSHQRANPADIYKFWNAWPSLNEQRAIADFLDAQTARMDALLTKRRALIEKLLEKRTALISRTVTRGLNPNAKFKASGVEWLGDIPQHWQQTTIRQIVEEHKQGFYTKDAYIDDGTPLLRITDIRENTGIDFGNCPKLEVSEKDRRQFGLKIGDFVFVRSGASIGKFGIVEAETDAIFGSYTIRFSFRKTVRRGFLKWFFQSRAFLDGLFAHLHGGAIVNVNADNIKDQVFAIPLLSEQQAIADHLDRETAKIDCMVAKVEAAIGKLQEYRTALITAAVTGKIDVRKIKPGNPPGRAVAAVTGKIEAGRKKP